MSDSNAAQHAKAREWWAVPEWKEMFESRVKAENYCNEDVYRRQEEGPDRCEIVHVREVLPGEITLTRQRMTDLLTFAVGFGTGVGMGDLNLAKEKSHEFVERQVRYLFDQLPEGQSAGGAE